MIRKLLLFVAALAASACTQSLEPGTAGIRLHLERNVYVPGDTVVVDLINDSDQSVGYDACSLTLERRVNNEWRPVTWGRLCQAIGYGIEPGARQVLRYPLEAPLPTGTYRLRHRVLPGGNPPERSIISAPLTIRASASDG